MENKKIDISKMKAHDFGVALKEIVLGLDSIRSGNNSQKPVDVQFSDVIQGKWGITVDSLLEKLNVNPKIDTMQNIYSMPDQSVRWIVPEIIRSAITLGIRQAPFYPNISPVTNQLLV